MTWWYGPTTIAALRLRVKKKDEITADHIAAMVEAGQVGLQFVGGQAVRQANLGEDNDPDLEINPIAVAKIQMEKDKEKARRKAEKEAAGKKAKAKAAKAKAAAKAATKAIGAAESIRSESDRRANKKPQLNILGIQISKERLPGWGKDAGAEEASQVGLKEFDAELATGNEARAKRAAKKAAEEDE